MISAAQLKAAAPSIDSAKARATRESGDILAGPRGGIHAFIDSTEWALLDATKVTLEIWAQYDGPFVPQSSATWTSAKVRAAMDKKDLGGRSARIGPVLSWEPDARMPKPAAFRVRVFSSKPITSAVKVLTE